VAFARKDYPKAMELYTYAIDRLGAPWKLKEALIGQAKCQVEMASAEKSPEVAKALYEKAKKTFEEVASVREWRGESTALALYHIADIQFRLQKFVEATAGWERITASQNKYPTWVARSYLRAADGYYRQGKNDQAQKKLRELFDPAG
jgi:tetratricopeptide (TPR) repeat protein